MPSCAAPGAHAPQRPEPPDAGPAAFAEGARPLGRYHSKRLGVSLPLPDGRGWRIDDHSHAELVAVHAATRSSVVVAVIRTEGLVGRTQCEEIARARKLVPDGDLRTLDDEVAVTQQTFDTRIRVALEAGATPDRPLVGHVMAFGGFLRKCYVFHFSTEVDDAAQEAALSSRLAFARARILGGLELDRFDDVGRDEPLGPEIAPTR